MAISFFFSMQCVDKVVRFMVNFENSILRCIIFLAKTYQYIMIIYNTAITIGFVRQWF